MNSTMPDAYGGTAYMGGCSVAVLFSREAHHADIILYEGLLAVHNEHHQA